MRAGRRAAATVTGGVASLALLLLSATGAAGVGWTPSVDDDSLLIRARNASRGAAEYEANPDAGAYVWKRDLPCWSRYPEIDRDSSEACWGGSAIQHDPPVCEDGAPLLPIWRRPRTEETWYLQVGWHCPEDLIPRMTQDDFRRMTIPAAPARMQPDGGPVLVNKQTIVYTETGVQTLRTDLLGYGVEVEATPVSYAWDFADGQSPLVTTSQGHRFPDHDVYSTYVRPGTARITLTTTWTGRYRVDVDPLHKWREIGGNAFTTSATADFEVVELRGHLDG
ncbi:hypothetical protein [Cellulomonas persica]|uniref:PKD domain-containing protein n=1 Tax=Cellulomonas persica TaxID=76861 RepID=A0A510UTE7_9CELL|nr:hypothetical protein [Cellulomonas persica]GEK17947.1 hypothetical protein CPE01_16800 [Cellulomonas persica]